MTHRRGPSHLLPHSPLIEAASEHHGALPLLPHQSPSFYLSLPPLPRRAPRLVLSASAPEAAEPVEADEDRVAEVVAVEDELSRVALRKCVKQRLPGGFAAQLITATAGRRKTAIARVVLQEGTFINFRDAKALTHCGTTDAPSPLLPGSQPKKKEEGRRRSRGGSGFPLNLLPPTGLNRVAMTHDDGFDTGFEK